MIKKTNTGQLKSLPERVDEINQWMKLHAARIQEMQKQRQDDEDADTKAVAEMDGEVYRLTAARDKRRDDVEAARARMTVAISDVEILEHALVEAASELERRREDRKSRQKKWVKDIREASGSEYRRKLHLREKLVKRIEAQRVRKASGTAEREIPKPVVEEGVTSG